VRIKNPIDARHRGIAMIAQLGKTVFKATDLCRDKMFEDVHLEIKAGEIVGLAGLIGAGRSEVVRAVFGLDPLHSGTVEVDGAQVKLDNPQKAIATGW
jgi:inositol transport system ATP-binding protein